MAELEFPGRVSGSFRDGVSGEFPEFPKVSGMACGGKMRHGSLGHFPTKEKEVSGHAGGRKWFKYSPEFREFPRKFPEEVSGKFPSFRSCSFPQFPSFRDSHLNALISREFPGSFRDGVSEFEFPGQSPQCINSTQNLRSPRPILQPNWGEFPDGGVSNGVSGEFRGVSGSFRGEFPGQSPQCINSTQNLRFPRPILQPN